MIERFRNLHHGQSIAILGSGPSLALFNRQQAIAIAVNGAAFSPKPYRYFMCGDLRSPVMPWFLSSQKQNATRIIATYLAPVDQLLFPDGNLRRYLREQIRPYYVKAHHAHRMSPLYHFVADFAPEAPHAWFRYAESSIPRQRKKFRTLLDQGKLCHGATISGVAIQMAYLMGASEIHLYGCSLDNDRGGNYFSPGISSGKTTETHRFYFSRLVDHITQSGVKIYSWR